MFVFGTLTEFSTGPMVTLFFAMLADTADYSEWKTNRRATGLFYSAGTVAMKFGSGVGGALTGFLLAAFGYVATSEAVMGQADSAVHGIRILISIVPAVVAVLMLIAFAFYRLDESLLTKIEHDLAARRLPAAHDPAARNHLDARRADRVASYALKGGRGRRRAGGSIPRKDLSKACEIRPRFEVSHAPLV